MSRRRARNLVRVAVFLFGGSTLLCAPSSVNALTFTPSEAEWLAWPDYCRARYVVSGAGIGSRFENRVSLDQVRAWSERLGRAWEGLHHYCAGLAIENRAKAEHDPAQRKFLLERVTEENRFTLNATPDSHPMWAEIAARTGLVYAELNEPTLALQYLDAAIRACPNCAVGYQAKAIYLRDQGKLTEARAALEAGNSAVEGGSAELHYFLGLVLVELKDFEKALEHAKAAYNMGYPLPGLSQRLARAGYSLR